MEKERFSISKLSFKQGDFSADNLALEFPEGKILSVLGGSGSGKTLLLKSIAGLIPLSSGEIFHNGKDLSGLSPALRNVGYVFEDYALFPAMTGRKNIEFPLKIQRQSKEKIARETKKRLKEVPIDEKYLDTLPKALPAGIKQLVAIAREKNQDLDLFILDEPMTHLDADQHLEIRKFLKKFVKDAGKTTIIASNDPEDSLALSDYIAVIDKGRILQVGETKEVYENPKNLAVMEAISKLGVNTLSVSVKTGAIVPFGIKTDSKDGDFTLAFRPEGTLPSDEGIPVTVLNSQFMSNNHYLCIGEYNGKILRFVSEEKLAHGKSIKIAPVDYRLF